MACAGKPLLWFAVLLAAVSQDATAQAEPERSTPSGSVLARLHSCWKPPPAVARQADGHHRAFSFNREGTILGRPRITYEMEHATDNDRLLYRMAVMEALQRCTPLPFTEALGGAIAGRPLTIPFEPKNHHPNRQRAEHG